MVLSTSLTARRISPITALWALARDASDFEVRIADSDWGCTEGLRVLPDSGATLG
jgi:hypothetical protein